MIRRILESPTNAAAMGGEVIIEEADDGVTALQALKAAAEIQRDTHKQKIGDTTATHNRNGIYGNP